MYTIIVRNSKVECAIFIVGVLLLLEVNCDNYTQKYPWDTFQTRENRLISFHTLEQGDIGLDLEFHVPFLTIPIKKTMSGALANINVGAIALTGAIVFGAVVAIPALIAVLNKKGNQWTSSTTKTVSESDTDNMMNEMASMFNNTSAMKSNDSDRENSAKMQNGSNGYKAESPEKKYRRYDEPPQSSSTYDWLHHLFTQLDSSFMQNLGSTVCIQRAICWAVRSSSSRMQASTQAQPTSVDKIVDGLATNEWVRYWARDSMFDSAIQFGLRRSNCAKLFGECRLSQSVISMLVKRFSAMINNP